MEGKFIIYQILLRVFANTNRKCVSGGSLRLNGSGKFSGMSRKVLESLRKFGVTHIWYTGIIEHATATPFGQIGLKGDNRLVVKGEAGSPYAIKDYYDVNPCLADNPASRMEEFEAMVERTHKAGLKVILDFVPNHLSRVTAPMSIQLPDSEQKMTLRWPFLQTTTSIICQGNILMRQT